MELKQALEEMLDQLYEEAKYAFKKTEMSALAAAPLDEMTLGWKKNLPETD